MMPKNPPEQALLDEVAPQAALKTTITYVTEAYEESGKLYNATDKTLRIGGYTSRSDLLAMLGGPNRQVPGLTTSLDHCQFTLVVRPATEEDANRAMRVGAPCVPFLVPRGDPALEIEDLENFRAVAQELRQASQEFGSFASAHEGFAILKEEVDKLWDEVKKSPSTWGREAEALGLGLVGSDLRRNALRAEAIQVAAMALRFLRDVCP